jgi:radical SAM family uncharacterized protein
MPQPTTDLWPRLRDLLPLAERPVRYLNHEFGSVYRTPEDDPADTSFVMVYPDTYELGQANQAIRILVNCVNAQPGMYAERAYLPAAEFADQMREAGLPLFSLESCAPLREFDAIGITLPHELAATNVLEVLDLAGLALRAEDRAEADPIVLGGGPCAFNPEPYSAFFDAICIGEGEEAMPEMVACIGAGRAAGKTRQEILEDLADIPGTYVPGFYRVLPDEEAAAWGYRVKPVNGHALPEIQKRVFEGFAQSPAWEPCIVPFADLVHDRLSVEILRGCTRGCRFCQAGMMYRPVRERSADNIVEGALEGLKQTGYDEVSLTSLSTTDHSQIKEILERMNAAVAGKGIQVSIPSQRLDSFGVDMAALVAGEKRGGLTFAPEAGTQRLRDVINKNVTEEDVFTSITAAFREGWRRCKLYFMIGLPTETDDDIRGIASLVTRVYEAAREVTPPDQRGRVRVSVSLSLFVPKAGTPFQWDGQIAPEEALRRVNLLRHSIKFRAIDVNWHDPATSFVEAVMSRGGRECCDVIEGAFKRGARMDAWTEHFRPEAWRAAAEEAGVDAEALAQRTFDLAEVLPWQHISSGVHLSYLRLEHKRAFKEQTTPDCSFGACTGCGLCPDYGIDVETQEVRVG